MNTGKPLDPRGYQALALKHALRLYDRTGMKPNAAYTPKAMLATAAKITGQSFKARDFKGAIAALEAWLAANYIGGNNAQ